MPHTRFGKQIAHKQLSNNRIILPIALLRRDRLNYQPINFKFYEETFVMDMLPLGSRIRLL